MNEWTEPYEDEFLKEQIELIVQEQKNAAEHGSILLSLYEQLWLPVLSDLPDVEIMGRGQYHALYGDFDTADTIPFHGALWFTPTVDIQLPDPLKNIKEWSAASAALELNARMLKIQVNEIEITFTSVNLNLSPQDLLHEVNRELVRTNAGVYVWRIEPIHKSSTEVHHLYSDGRVPALSNAHTRADVTGYAILKDRPYQHTLIYVGIAAYKTSIESLWASLIRGRGSCSLQGISVLADGEVKMLTQPLTEFNVLHAGVICRKALPGKWEAKDDVVYAMVFEQGMDLETELQRLAVKRLQEALAFPIPDEWTKNLWERALDAGYIQRLDTGGDCRGGVRMDLSKPWQELIQNLLEQEVLLV